MPPPETVDPLLERLQVALGGRFRVLRELGRGGMGAVYLAREDALERLVAIKVMSAGGPDSRERFRREARTAAGLSHPNIVPLHAFGETPDGVSYLVMGYVQGEPLSARLRRDGRLPAAEVRRLLAEVADALHYAHRLGVVHRDVKPDNILVDDGTGRALLTDFGIARPEGAAHLTHEGALVGTPLFMSPEQCAGRTVTGRSDVYSLGVTAYLLLSGRPPFEAGNVADLLARHQNAEARPLRVVAPDVPEDLSAAVARCLAKDPEARFADAGDLRDTLAPRGVDLDRLPEPLDVLDGMAPLRLPFVLLIAFCLWEWLLWGTSASALVKAAALVVGGWLVFQVPLAWTAIQLARQRGFPVREIGRALVRQPVGWPCFWYPQHWRRAGDVWDRLPASVRVWRGGITLAVAVGMLGAAALMVVGSPRAASWDLAWPLAAGLLVFAAAAALVALAGHAAIAARVLRLGLDRYALRRLARALLSGPAGDRLLWKRPDVAPFLRSAEGERPQTPKELVDSIGRRAGALSRDDGWLLLEQARVLEVQAVEAQRDIERLQAALVAADADHVASQLERLGEAATEASRRLRGLLEQQRDVAVSLQSELQAARDRYQQHVDALVALWRRAPGDSTGGTMTRTR